MYADNNRNLGYSYNNHTTASKECYRNGSFIKWYQDDFCKLNNAINPFWTSGRRLKHIFHLYKSDNIHNGELHRCFKLQRDDDNKRISEEDEEDCNEMYPFVCNFGWTEDGGDTAFNSTTSIPPEKNVQSDITASIVAGVIVSIFAAIAVILVLLFIHRRRQTKNKPNIHESQTSHVQDTIGLHSNHKTSQAPVYNDIDGEDLSRNNRKFKYPQTTNYITYNQVNSNIIPKPQNVYHSVNMTSEANSESNELNSKAGKKEYGVAKVKNVIRDSSEGGNSSNYYLAKPITSTTEEETDPYDINKDYDHLHNVKKKEDPITKVYDHLPTTVTDDPTYDHSNLKCVSDNEGYYDHFKIDEVND